MLLEGNMAAENSLALPWPSCSYGDMRHPEIESGLISDEYLRHRDALASKTTSIDLLEIPRDPRHDIGWWEGLDHGGLLQHFKVCLIFELFVLDKSLCTNIGDAKAGFLTL